MTTPIGMASPAHASLVEPLAESLDYQVTPFYIPATASQQERRLRSLKRDDLFAVFDYYGDIIPGSNNPDGLYCNDTRFLSARLLLINDTRPLLLSSTIQDNNTLLTVDLTNPDVILDGQVLMPKDTIHLKRSIFLSDNSCYERLHVLNFDEREQTIALTMTYGCDFTDLFEVRGMTRTHKGKARARKVDERQVRFDYLGLDEEPRAFLLDFDPKPAFLDVKRVRYEITLKPHERVSVYIAARCIQGSAVDGAHQDFGAKQFFATYRHARKSERCQAAQIATVETSNKIFNEVLCRSAADLAMLMTETPYGPYPYAGIPWYSTAFGRDGIITALEMLWADPVMAKGVLNYLAATQATEVIAESDAEPGKILHETRRCEMANTGEVPFGLYYGSVDSTPAVRAAGRTLFRPDG